MLFLNNKTGLSRTSWHSKRQSAKLIWNHPELSYEKIALKNFSNSLGNTCDGELSLVKVRFAFTFLLILRISSEQLFQRTLPTIFNGFNLSLLNLSVPDCKDGSVLLLLGNMVSKMNINSF